MKITKFTASQDFSKFQTFREKGRRDGGTGMVGGRTPNQILADQEGQIMSTT